MRKPWGRERLLVESADGAVAVWHLRIEPGQSTSMHMHRIKKTALVVLGGECGVRFISGSMSPKVGEKIRFAPGQYHQSSAYSGMLDLLEVETPSDKDDLVRLEDQYGRVGKGYEGRECFEADAEPFLLNLDYTGEKSLWGRLGECRIGVQPFPRNRGEGILIFLSGGIRHGTMPIISPGDVVDASTLRRLASQYEMLHSAVLEVRHFQSSFQKVPLVPGKKPDCQTDG